MSRELLMAVVLAVLVLLLVLMVLGWRARQRRQAGLPSADPVPSDLGEVRAVFEALYVSTTVANEPMERITVAGLGYRSRATVTVTSDGIVLALAAVDEVFIPAERIRGVHSARLTIDRVVEQDGLVLIAWILGTPGQEPAATEVDSYLRLDRSGQLIDAIASIVPTSTGRTA